MSLYIPLGEFSICTLYGSVDGRCRLFQYDSIYIILFGYKSDVGGGGLGFFVELPNADQQKSLYFCRISTLYSFFYLFSVSWILQIEKAVRSRLRVDFASTNLAQQSG